ncbi:MAG TPA: hypothetical protein RMH85_30215 [Polyangiaceae bacterium LLY-WYZ-15_(1-7)]|nr:hypothetical protein [Myxococcales bacterium]MAT29282.1 hypothetical protein [Sandaracinus sp.]HJL05467.1 hypothetical protein [Polyangiaceae bacterium LLY-WYZ-15_(1-7)]MBJ73270.1 hypothetical protein [Sandaracinus sp.]HJL12796.1 hypothetical protein [Polyangiaceae bacterium LLY-WYZ-15_(1-7)]
MNFFGHCYVACWERRDPAFVLGSMLPDFATMVGTRLAGAEDAGVEAGIAHHHAVDGVFHSTGTFVGWMREAGALLDAKSVRWGTARAVAHIGVELLLDGVLVAEERAANAAYLEALEAARPGALGEQVRFKHDAASERFDALCGRLREYGLPEDVGSPETVTLRLERALAPRERLRMHPGDRPAVRRCMEAMLPRVRERTDQLLGELHAGLAGAPR